VLVGAAIAVSVVAPYWWGVPGGVVGFVADNSLVLIGFAGLITWANALCFNRAMTPALQAGNTRYIICNGTVE
jgi:hypothetical protein